VKAVVVLAAAALAVLPTVPTSDAAAVCVGYQQCYQMAGDGWAVFCTTLVTGHWKCVDVVCESCGNLPPLGLDVLP
jgi:hypothetical protein